MSKVTDMMYDLIYKEESRDDSYVIALEAVLEKHTLTAVDLLEGDELANFMGARAFSEVVKEAAYTKPDPRDDLSGMDIARKACFEGNPFRTVPGPFKLCWQCVRR